MEICYRGSSAKDGQTLAEGCVYLVSARQRINLKIVEMGITGAEKEIRNLKRSVEQKEQNSLAGPYYSMDRVQHSSTTRNALIGPRGRREWVWFAKSTYLLVGDPNRYCVSLFSPVVRASQVAQGEWGQNPDYHQMTGARATVVLKTSQSKVTCKAVLAYCLNLTSSFHPINCHLMKISKADITMKGHGYRQSSP